MMELIKNHGFVPGNDLFFYRDQNGVEIDFVIEKKGKLILIEAKAGERVDPKKLHFSRVAELFEEKHQFEKFLAQNIDEKTVLKLKGTHVLIPCFIHLMFPYKIRDQEYNLETNWRKNAHDHQPAIHSLLGHNRGS